jgi:hypothetical protein
MIENSLIAAGPPVEMSQGKRDAASRNLTARRPSVSMTFLLTITNF